MKSPRQLLPPIVLFAPLALIAACGDGNDTVQIKLTAQDGPSGQPLAGVLLVGEIGGIYQRYDDPSLANPHYTLGGVSDTAGIINLEVPEDKIGFHLFQNGYRYGVASIESGKATEVTAPMEPHLPADVQPTAGNVKVTPTPAAPGAPVTITASVSAGLPCADPLNPDASCDPLSDEVVIVAPELGWCRGMKPPSLGAQGTGYPDGLWTTTFDAPATTGEHTLYLVVSSEKCVTSDRVPITLQVR